MAPGPELPDSHPRRDVLVGKVLDRYRVLEKIGEGGMGAVYRVEHIMLQKHMAMKLLRFELSQNEELVVRFQNEAIAAGRIGQENIVAVSDFGRTPDGLVYFVMEELHGESLAVAICQEPRFPLERVINIAAQCCRALHAAHAVGIVHRDLKPENVVLTTREGVPDFVKILDFGISKIIEMTPNPEGQKLTRAGMIVGTPEYMSPEQASGKSVDARSDIYSLGVVIFEMLTGKLPFKADNALQMLLQHQSGEVPALSKVHPGLKVPGKLEKVVRRALSKRPEDRQQSMAEFLNELQSCADKLELTQPALRLIKTPSRAKISLKPARVAPTRPSAGLEVDDLVVAGLAKPSRSKRWRVGAIGLLVALVSLGALLAFNSRRQEQPPAVIHAPSAPPVAVPIVAAPVVPPSVPEPVPTPVPPVPIVAPVATAPVPESKHALAEPSHTLHPHRPKPAVASPASTHAASTKSTPDPYGKVDELKSPYPAE